MTEVIQYAQAFVPSFAHLTIYLGNHCVSTHRDVLHSLFIAAQYSIMWFVP